jgi:hypothetical protein
MGRLGAVDSCGRFERPPKIVKAFGSKTDFASPACLN